jgi:hypothetical protein
MNNNMEQQQAAPKQYRTLEDNRRKAFARQTIAQERPREAPAFTGRPKPEPEAETVDHEKTIAGCYATLKEIENDIATLQAADGKDPRAARNVLERLDVLRHGISPLAEERKLNDVEEAALEAIFKARWLRSRDRYRTETFSFILRDMMENPIYD